MDNRAFDRSNFALVLAMNSVVLWLIIAVPSLALLAPEACVYLTLFNGAQIFLLPIVFIRFFWGYRGKGGKLLTLASQIVILLTWFLSVWNVNHCPISDM